MTRAGGICQAVFTNKFPDKPPLETAKRSSSAGSIYVDRRRVAWVLQAGKAYFARGLVGAEIDLQ
eukprot:1234111-Lingulodinium_polyedra.AAC.1